MTTDASHVRLETERLLLRPSVEADAGVFRQLWTERDPRVPVHRKLDADGRPTVEEIAEDLLTRRADPGLGLLTVHQTEGTEVIGYCGITSPPWTSGERPELAFELLRSVHGRGYGTEAGRAVLGWARGSGYLSLWASVREWNLASRRVLAKLGFHETDEVEIDTEHGNSIMTVVEL